jgi:hypothetical protein
MANDSSLLPATAAAPGRATLYTAERTVAISGATGPGVVTSGGGSVTTTDIEFDYSAHLDRIVTALEQMSLSMAFLADKLDNLSDKINVNTDNVTTLVQQNHILVNQVTTLAEQITREAPRVLEAVANFDGTATVVLNEPLAIDPSGYFLQGPGILSGTYVILYDSINKTLKLNRAGYLKIENGSPLVTSNVAQNVPITLIPPVVMTANNISNIIDDSGNLKVISPWEWLGISSITKLYDERGVDYNALKSRVDSIPKSTS